MILCLTYHRIVGTAAEATDFFDTPVAAFETQLRIAATMWGGAKGGETARELLCKGGSGLLITFDDGTADHYATAASLLEKHGHRGVFFVNTARFGVEGYVDAAQCVELAARGHAIESHSHEHRKLHRLSPQEVGFQLSESRRILQSLGLGQLDFLAAPGGYYSDTVLEEAPRAGYAFARTTKWGYNRHLDPLRIESILLNRSLSESGFRFLASPRFERAKKCFFQSKELLKNGPLKTLYFGLRDRLRDGK